MKTLDKDYSWIQCEDPKVDLFYTLCKKWGRPSPSATGGRQVELLTRTILQNN